MTPPAAITWATLSALLDELSDLPEAARAARVLTLRSESPALADALDEWLRDNDRAAAGGFLEKAVAPSSPEIAAADAAASLVGQRLGAYVLDAPLGQGGGGSVWRAQREDGRYAGAVAVKLLHLSLLGRAGAERFRREGQILARLTHPTLRTCSMLGSRRVASPIWCSSWWRASASTVIVTPGGWA
jgi:eukaryotic-like serine/threonine-protein kinase